MSWPEVKKINSDFVNEPLNFNNYINDISTFGKYSYALDTENETLWLSLISQSLTLFGHDAIHDTVYERFTDDEVDYMITKNARLGQSLNSFYSIDDFASGPVDTVIKSITIAAYNKLDIKFQNGINRYISSHTSENAGAWLTSVFDIDMSSYQTMDDLLADTAFWNSTVASNESLRFVISLSVSSAEYMASHTDSSIYVSFIETVAQSTDATMTLINALAATAQLDTFFANESVCNTIANSAPSMTAICYNLDGFSSLINSDVAMGAVQNSNVAQDTIIDLLIVVSDNTTKLDIIHSSLDTIEENVSSMAEGEIAISHITDAKDKITSCEKVINSILDKADVLVNTVPKMLDNEEFVKLIISTKERFTKLANTTFNSKIAEIASRLDVGRKITQSLSTALPNKPFILTSIRQSATGGNVNVTYGIPEVTVTYQATLAGEKAVYAMFSSLSSYESTATDGPQKYPQYYSITGYVLFEDE